MTFVLIRKLLRDIWLSFVVVIVLLLAFECLWARVTQRVTGALLPELSKYILKKRKDSPLGFIPAEILRRESVKIAKDVQKMVFTGPGRLVQSLIGGESVDLTQAQHAMSVGYVHPLVQVILCIWAIGRAAGAITGEIDRGTMELLLAQPVPRWKLVWAHLCIDALTIPLVCLSMWAGIWLGAWMVGMLDLADPTKRVDPWPFAPGLLNTALLVFAVSGYTMFLSALGRFRNQILGVAVVITLLQFLVNLFGQIWEPVEVLRPWTVFYYYQPQAIILHSGWAGHADVWLHLGVLLAVGAIGYLLALLVFCRRDLPAPL